MLNEDQIRQVQQAVLSIETTTGFGFIMIQVADHKARWIMAAPSIPLEVPKEIRKDEKNSLIQ